MLKEDICEGKEVDEAMEKQVIKLRNERVLCYAARDYIDKLMLDIETKIKSL